MTAEKLTKIKFRGLSWVIILTFDTAQEANEFAEKEGLKVKIGRNDGTVIARIDE